MSLTDVWLDCDPGCDDAFAILLCAFSPKLNLLGISTVSGNHAITKMTTNTLKILNLIGYVTKPSEIAHSDLNEVNLWDCQRIGGLKVPVIEGCGVPFLGKPIEASHIHGESGLEGDFPSVPTHAVEYVQAIGKQKLHFTTQIYQYFKSLSKKITILAIGPLTNVALLLFNHPEVKDLVEKVVFMGGSMTLGNL